jgi:hypothetical protein
MSALAILSTQEAADRLALLGLFDAYARCADTRYAEGQKPSFTTSSRFAVSWMVPGPRRHRSPLSE